MFNLNILTLTTIFALVSTTSGLCQDLEIRFNRDVRPILSDKCFACHGPDAKHVAAGLRLDDAEDAIDSGAIVAGKPEDSELIERIFADDEDVIMPPPDVHKPLSENERDVLRRWIKQGAGYEPHWAYVPMDRGSVRPEGASRNEERSRNLVDRFVDAQLEASATTPVEQADRTTLIRRLSIDLTGIPPTLEEVDSFVNDQSNDAYTRLVDRLLNSPRYGERMATYWLDLVRYADTVGYHGDQEVSQWPYRDYVINSFNKNVGYDQFIKEQLAGDLLPDPTTQQLVASGYNRLNQTTEEGGAQAKEYLAIYFADRVRNASQVFMGSTLGCAQCHDHKYDPFTTRDFYSFGAFFADLEERGVYGGRGSRPPVLPLPTDEQQETIAALKLAIGNSEKQELELREQLLKNIDRWTPEATTEFVLFDDNKPDAGTFQGEWNFESGESTPVHSQAKSRKQQGTGTVQHYFDDVKESPVLTSQTSFFTWVYLDPENPPKSIMVQLNDGSGWNHRAVWGGDEIPYGRRNESWAGYQRMGQLPETGKWVKLEISASDVGFDGTVEHEIHSVTGIAFTQFNGLVWWDETGWNNQPSKELLTALETEKVDRTREQTKLINGYYLSTSNELREFSRAVEEAKAELKDVESSVSNTVISSSVEPREIRILPRGNWMDDSGEVVQPAIPSFLGTIDTGNRRATRLDLANWLGSETNPLTSRTMVNRLWSLMFGRGISTSVDDFGGQGSYPSNPELLDALAIEFVDSGWDVKHILRLIVESDAYQRSSRPSSELREQDPYNNLFARQGRFRFDAEVVRDSALFLSGRLVERVGGPSVRPYQPAGYYAELNFPKRKYIADMDDNQYRRGLYTHWQRTFLHPMLKAFDAPSREECTAQRARSSTPLQALTLMNDPTFVEAAKHFAVRIINEGGTDRKERVRWAYRTALSHAPEEEIVDVLVEVYDSHSGIYNSDQEAVSQLLSVGNSTLPDDMSPAEVASWMGVARTIFNLHETTTRY